MTEGNWFLSYLSSSAPEASSFGHDMRLHSSPWLSCREPSLPSLLSVCRSSLSLLTTRMSIDECKIQTASCR